MKWCQPRWALVVICLFLCLPLSAQIPTVFVENPDSGHASNRTGQDVEIDDGWLAVGVSRGRTTNLTNLEGYVQLWRADTGGDWALEQELIASTPTSNAEFGDAVSIDGSTLVVGAPQQTTILVERGSAFVFEYDSLTWSETAHLRLNNGAEDDRFGDSVAISGDLIVVGAPGRATDNGETGAAYVFERVNDAWSRVATLVPSTGSDGDEFGASVAISGQTVIVGAPGADSYGTDSGDAFVFTKDGNSWVDAGSLKPGGLSDGAEFGADISVADDHLAVGAPGYSEAGQNVGAVFLYAPDTGLYSFDRILFSSSPENDAGFGRSVDIAGTSLIAGGIVSGTPSASIFEFDGTNWQFVAPFADETSNFSFGWAVAIDGEIAAAGCRSCSTLGEAYVYRRDSGRWSEEFRVNADGRASSDSFGAAVAMDRSAFAIGAPGDRYAGNLRGSVHIFERDGQQYELRQSLRKEVAGATSPFFGIALALEGDSLLVGAPRANASLTDAGAAFIYTRSGDVWNEEAELVSPDPALGDSFGFAVALSEDGSEAVVGAPTYTGSAPESGAAIYYANPPSWSEVIPLDSEKTLLPNNRFGQSLAFAEDIIVVGAPGDGFQQAGSAFVFTRSTGGWQVEEELVPSLSSPAILFGRSVAISNGVIFVGAPGSHGSQGGINGGAVYLFRKSAGRWNEERILSARPNAGSNSFGFSLLASGNALLVGAYTSSITATSGGAAYLFLDTQTRGWYQIAELVPPGLVNSDRFGNAVALDGDVVLGGASTQWAPEYLSGAAYLMFPSFEEPAPLLGWSVY